MLNSIAAVELVRDLAAAESVHVYLAGDAIRDCFFGIAPAEFDFMVSGDPAELARKVAASKPGQVKSNESGTVIGYRGELGILTFVPLTGLSVQQSIDLHYCFTVNCVVLDLERQELSYFHGAREDLEDQIIRARSPENMASFSTLAPLRAVRLAVSIPGGKLDHQTMVSIRSNSSAITNAHPYRVFNELSALLMSDQYRQGLELLFDTGLLQQIYERFLPVGAADAHGPDDANGLSRLMSVLNICGAMDDLLEPLRAALSESIPDYLVLLRMAALLVPDLKKSLLNTPDAERKRFLIARGEEIESALSKAMMPSRAFRIRVICVAYLLGIGSAGGGSVDIAEASRQSVKAFGAWKGGLAAILICADRLAHEGTLAAKSEMTRVTRPILETSIAPMIRRRAV